jgi:hypothetical protein
MESSGQRYEAQRPFIDTVTTAIIPFLAVLQATQLPGANQFPFAVGGFATDNSENVLTAHSGTWKVKSSRICDHRWLEGFWMVLN